jgi:hypothetical protein
MRQPPAITSSSTRVARGDMDAIVADFAEELRPEVPQIAQTVLPKSVTKAEV